MVTAMKTARMVVDENSGTTMVSCSALSARALSARNGTDSVKSFDPRL